MKIKLTPTNMWNFQSACQSSTKIADYGLAQSNINDSVLANTNLSNSQGTLHSTDQLSVDGQSEIGKTIGRVFVAIAIGVFVAWSINKYSQYRWSKRDIEERMENDTI